VTAESFATPEAAFERLLAKGHASLVLLDLRTPGMSAQRFRALLMSAPGLRDLPVIVVSGAPEIHRVAAALGSNAAFAKPVDVDRLVETVAVLPGPLSPGRRRQARLRARNVN
jgi:CheY-like chemotaxis protein